MTNRPRNCKLIYETSFAIKAIAMTAAISLPLMGCQAKSGSTAKGIAPISYVNVDQDIARLKVGMSQSELEEAFGPPLHIYPGLSGRASWKYADADGLRYFLLQLKDGTLESWNVSSMEGK